VPRPFAISISCSTGSTRDEGLQSDPSADSVDGRPRRPLPPRPRIGSGRHGHGLSRRGLDAALFPPDEADTLGT
jgi:hypothetical protein